jgi:hypothetical protein
LERSWGAWTTQVLNTCSWNCSWTNSPWTN